MQRLNRFGGPVLIAIAIILGGLYFLQVHEESERSTCQASYNTAFATNLQIRSTLSAQRQDAEDALLSSITTLVLHPAVTAAEKTAANQAFLTAFQNYQAADAAYTAQKDANPLPPIPSC